MFTKFINFIKYNNAFVFILLAIVLVGGSAFAATDAGQAAIGQQITSVQGVDNTLLLTANPDALEMNFKIEKIEQDVDYYYVTYTLLDLVKVDNAWQYQLTEKSRKVTKKIRQDLGVYLAEEFKQEHDAIVKDLKAEQAKASIEGEQIREEVTQYTGLIGKTLDVVAAVFPNYEPVKRRELPSPDFTSPCPSPSKGEGTTTPSPCQGEGRGEVTSIADNLTAVYNSYIAENDPDHDSVFGAADNCPLIYNPDQKDTDADGVGDACDIDQMLGGTATTTASSTPSADSANPTPLSGHTTSSPSSDSTSSIPLAPKIQPDIVIPPASDLTGSTSLPSAAPKP